MVVLLGDLGFCWKGRSQSPLMLFGYYPPMNLPPHIKKPQSATDSDPKLPNAISSFFMQHKTIVADKERSEE